MTSIFKSSFTDKRKVCQNILLSGKLSNTYDLYYNLKLHLDKIMPNTMPFTL